jgi:uncharacterized coiled-coil protein SlyX
MANPPEPQATDEARLLRLEEKVAYQDKLVAELNEVVVSLHRVTDSLSDRLRTIERELRSELGARDMPNEPPPHY